MKIKELELQNGKKVTISLSSFNKGEFNLFAIDEKLGIVAKCGFDIISTYVLKQPVTDTNSCQSSTANKPIFEKHEIKVGNVEYTQQKKVIFRNGEIYSLQDTRCELQLIEICDENFSKIGLGSELLKQMEEFSIQHHCTKIAAKVHPFGPFGIDTMPFYTRNGFILSKDDTGHTFATKTLQKNKIDDVIKD